MAMALRKRRKAMYRSPNDSPILAQTAATSKHRFDPQPICPPNYLQHVPQETNNCPTRAPRTSTSSVDQAISKQLWALLLF
mmetsp:Transcript_40578/g.63357  ORF Transcript_40578/g.63357 Transcript_40578/m.63357 type:complete len:81 (-) Transcript_40578:132-374(-)